MKRILFFLLTFLFGIPGISFSQIKYNIETGALVSAGKQAPFGLISNQYGKYSLEKYQYYLDAEASKKTDYTKKFDYGFGLELFDRVDDKNTFWLHQGYGEVKYRFLRFQAGVREEVFGIHDTLLSSGSFIWSGNARPIPKLTISTPGFIDVPYTKGNLQFQALLSHGWFEYDRYVHHPYLHHKNLYLQVGPKWPVTFTFGMEHFVMWGGTSSNTSIGKLPAGWDTYKKIFLGREIPVDSTSVLYAERNAVGNHLGTYNIGVRFNIMAHYSVFCYIQHPFEDGSGLRWRNWDDGLFGISVKNTSPNSIIRAVNYEMVRTLNQGIDGNYTVENEPDNYFNNYLYLSGWTTYGHVIGTPVLGFPAGNNSVVVSNNRVLAHHTGMCAEIPDYRVRFDYFHTRNKGTMFEEIKPAQYQQTIGTTIEYSLYDNFALALSAVYEWGRLYGNNFGVLVNLRYTPIYK